LHGAEEGEFVGVFKSAAGGEALSDAGEAAVFAAQHFGNIVGGGLAFDIGSEGEHNFHFASSGEGGVDALQELGDAQVFG
jgi:hypothetical protein